MNKIFVFCLVLTLFLFWSCGGKYSFDFDRGKHLDFSKGKWILNQPKTNKDITDWVNEIALEEFSQIIPDKNLITILELRQTNLVWNTFPYKVTPSILSEIKAQTQCNYLINIECYHLKNEVGSITAPRDFGVSIPKNTARTIIKIYSLDKLELISSSTADALLESREDEDSGWSLVNSSKNLAFSSLKKLIRKYGKYRINK